VTLSGRDRGQFVAGGRRKFSDAVEVYAENTYDLFGVHRSLTSVYGVDYKPSEFLTYSTSVELGRISDPLGDFDRTAVSLGVRYQDEAGLSAKARLEFRRDEGLLSGTDRDGDTVAFTSTARYKIRPSRMQPNARGDVQVRFEDVDFAAVLRWLHQLEYTENVQIREVSINQGDRSGTVNASVRIGQDG
jgi:hypothetical protein